MDFNGIIIQFNAAGIGLSGYNLTNSFFYDSDIVKFVFPVGISEF